MKHLLVVLALFLLFGCKEQPKETVKSSDAQMVFDMYEPSEMANLMNAMYAHNLEVKAQIINGELPTEFPLDFLKIHTAELSDFKKRNATFESFSELFIQAEREVYNVESDLELKERFNNAVNVCVSCHQTECTGPIPRIKKLLIP